MKPDGASKAHGRPDQLRSAIRFAPTQAVCLRGRPDRRCEKISRGSRRQAGRGSASEQSAAQPARYRASSCEGLWRLPIDARESLECPVIPSLSSIESRAASVLEALSVPKTKNPCNHGLARFARALLITDVKNVDSSPAAPSAGGSERLAGFAVLPARRPPKRRRGRRRRRSPDLLPSHSDS